jgi:hypothetical protein
MSFVMGAEYYFETNTFAFCHNYKFTIERIKSDFIWKLQARNDDDDEENKELYAQKNSLFQHFIPSHTKKLF